MVCWVHFNMKGVFPSLLFHANAGFFFFSFFFKKNPFLNAYLAAEPFRSLGERTRSRKSSMRDTCLAWLLLKGDEQHLQAHKKQKWVKSPSPSWNCLTDLEFKSRSSQNSFQMADLSPAYRVTGRLQKLWYPLVSTALQSSLPNQIIRPYH